MTELLPNGPAPYTTGTSALIAMDAYRDRGLGTPITAEVLTRAGVKETIASRTLVSLKLLGLVEEDGRPSDLWDQLKATRTDEDYQARLQEWLHRVYADVLRYTNPSEDPPDKVADAFRGYKPEGQRMGMASLLIALWRYAGLPVPEGAGAPRPAQSVFRRVSAPRPRRREQSGSGGDGPKHAPRDGSQDLPPELVGLLRSVPRGNEGWTADKREAFLNAFTAVLDYSVPIVEENVAGESRENEEEETV